MNAPLLVFIGGELAGRVAAERGLATFRYRPAYAARSISPPVSSTWFKDEAYSYQAEPWLEGLLSDNPHIREQLAVDFGAASTRAVDLLATELGLDCAGAVQVVTEHNAHLVTNEGSKQRLTDTGVEHLVDRVAAMVPASRSGTQPPATFSLAGVHNKVALGRDRDGWYLPSGRHPTTHILKPSSAVDDRFPNLVTVEHVSMAAARGCGLEAARTEVCEMAGRETIVVERFDRALNDGAVERRHQEDLCQALGFWPTQKYEAHRGPGVHHAARLLRRVAPDRANARRFLAALAFNWMIAGTDAHGKNYSLLLEGSAAVLAPLYDVTSHLPYRGTSDVGELPLSMKGTAPSNRLADSDNPDVWLGNAATMGLTAGEARDLLVDLVEGMPTALDAAVATVPEQLQCREVDAFVDDMTRRRLPVCRRVVERIDRQVRKAASAAQEGRRSVAHRRRRSDRELDRRAVELKHAGHTNAAIAARLGRSLSWVQKRTAGINPQTGRPR